MPLAIILFFQKSHTLSLAATKQRFIFLSLDSSFLKSSNNLLKLDNRKLFLDFRNLFLCFILQFSQLFYAKEEKKDSVKINCSTFAGLK
jgi:hypothetical protein